jgi:glycerophosphoryl diester phosphodiesterase
MEFLNIAHRGASGYAPENTLSAFRLAKKMGADMIEFDLWETRDGNLVVLHDRSLRRTTGLRRRVTSLTIDQIRDLDAGSWFHSAFQGERVPTLEEVLTAIEGIDFNIEIKEADPKRVLASLARFGKPERVILSSFDHLLLQTLRRLDPRARIGYLVDRESWRTIWRESALIGPFSFHLPLRRLGTEVLRGAHAEGMKVFVYTVNQRAEMRRLIRMGVDGIFTNYPDRLSRQLQDLGV